MLLIFENLGNQFGGFSKTSPIEFKFEFELKPS
jgi:hypothetical protein